MINTVKPTVNATAKDFATYNDGKPYRPARGRLAPRAAVEDVCRDNCAVIDLDREQPSPQTFLRLILREMRIRFYRPKSIKAYRNALRGFLRWFRYPLSDVTREDVRQYLELLVDGGASASWVGINLSAIRTAFDKMCGRDVTLGLLTPRRPKRLPVVLSAQEVKRLLQAAPSLRDKLLLGLMYATGMRVSEVVRLRWQEIDFDRRAIRVWQGKGQTDRMVMLPESFAPLLIELSRVAEGKGYVFPSHQRTNRHLSPRSAQRAMQRALQIAGIHKAAVCHSLRHSFATHLVRTHYAARRVFASVSRFLTQKLKLAANQQKSRITRRRARRASAFVLQLAGSLAFDTPQKKNFINVRRLNEALPAASGGVSGLFSEETAPRGGESNPTKIEAFRILECHFVISRG